MQPALPAKGFTNMDKKLKWKLNQDHRVSIIMMTKVFWILTISDFNSGISSFYLLSILFWILLNKFLWSNDQLGSNGSFLPIFVVCDVIRWLRSFWGPITSYAKRKSSVMPSAEANASTEIQMHCHDNNKCSLILILAYY